MGYGMKYTNGKKADTTAFPFKTDLTKKLSIVASESAKEDADADNEEANKKETERINTTPNTRPPMFSDADAHRKVKKSLNIKKASNKKRSDAEKELEAKEDAMGL